MYLDRARTFQSSEDWSLGDKCGLVCTGTHRLLVEVSGPKREQGEPIVIVSPGAGASLESWQEVQQLVVPFARVLLYDRASLGQSDQGPIRDTASASTEELLRLLKVLSVGGPYILVARSYNGGFACEFLYLRFEDVVGTVCFSSSSITAKFSFRIASECDSGRSDRADSLSHIASVQRHPRREISALQVLCAKLSRSSPRNLPLFSIVFCCIAIRNVSGGASEAGIFRIRVAP